LVKIKYAFLSTTTSAAIFQICGRVGKYNGDIQSFVYACSAYHVSFLDLSQIEFEAVQKIFVFRQNSLGLKRSRRGDRNAVDSRDETGMRE